MAIRVAINGFGRIGRNVLRAAWGRDDIEIVAINDLTDPATLAHLLKYDSIQGIFRRVVSADTSSIRIDGKAIHICSEKKPADLPWKGIGIDYVIESTGLFVSREAAAGHLAAGAKRVIISAPGKEVDATLCMAVNHSTYDPERHQIVSNASCTTNCLAPVARVLHEQFNILRGMMTTVHSYTNDQRILDLPHKDLRRARAAALSMIPTTTGAAKAVGLVLPELQGKLEGMAIRVPTPNVSCIDLVVEVETPTDRDGVNAALRAAAEGPMQGVLDYTELPLVSCDFNGSSASSTVDASLTTVVGGTMIKVIAWYDNEWGYSNRVVDLVTYMASRD